MEEQQKRMVELLVEHAIEYGSGVEGDPVKNPNDREKFLKQNLIDDLNFDSLDTVELTMVFEDEYDISLPDELFENLSAEEYTAGKFIEIVAEQLSKTRVDR